MSKGEIIIVPLVAGIGDMEDELFTLNDTGKAIWDTLDRRRGLACVVATARNPQSKEAEDGAIERDGLASSPSSSRATCWSPPEPGQGRRRFCFGAARHASRQRRPLPPSVGVDSAANAMTQGRRQCHRQKQEARAHGRADEKSLEHT